MCLTEFRLGLTELPKNVKTEIFLPKLLFLIKILKNPHDRIHEMQFKKLCQEDFTIGPLLRVVLGKTFTSYLFRLPKILKILPKNLKFFTKNSGFLAVRRQPYKS